MPLQVAGSGEHPAQDAASAELATLRQRLKARDGAIRTIRLAYEALTHYPRSVPRCPPTERGWWYWQADAQAAAALIGCAEENPYFEHIVWDGTTARQAKGKATWEDFERLLKGEFPPSEQAAVATTRTGLLSKSSHPGELGLFCLSSLWSSYLDNFSNLQLTEHALVCGRNCCVLIGDMDGRQNDLAYTFPWRIAFDEETLLAVRVEFYAREPQSSPSQATLELGGVQWRRRSYTSVDKQAELTRGFWIGVHGMTGSDGGDGTYAETTVRLDGSFLNQPAPAGYLAGAFQDGTHVDDAPRGEQYYAGHEGDDVYTVNRLFFDELKEIAPERALAWQATTALKEPFSSASWAAVALYAMLWLAGESPTLDSLIGNSGFKRATNKPTVSPEDLAAALESAGYPATVLGSEGLEQIDEQWFLGGNRTDSSPSTRFVLLKKDPENAVVGRITLFRPMVDVRQKGSDEALRSTDGRFVALVRGRVERPARFWSNGVRWLSIGGIGALALLVLARGARAAGKRGVAQATTAVARSRS